MYTLQHARFQTTPRRSPLYSCMHGFQTSGSLIQIFEFNFTLIMTSPILLHPHSSLLFIIVPLTFSRACMHTHYQSALSIAHMQSFSSGRSPMKAHTHTSPSPSYRAFFISHVHAQRSMFLYVCVYIARSFIVFHINRSIYISSEVSPSFPRPHRSIYTSLYRITYIANTPTLIIYPTPPSHHPCLPLHLSDARTMAKTGGSKGPAPLTSLYIEANMNVIIRQLLVKWFKLMNWPSS